MLDSFLKVAFSHAVADTEQKILMETLAKLPKETLYKLASGELKLSEAYTKVGHEGLEWLEQFKGTPLFERAIGLEQQAMQVEMMRVQKETERSEERKVEPDFYDLADKIRVQKKMLGLELATQQLQEQGGSAGAPPMSAAPPAPPPQGMPPAGPQGGGAMGDDGPPKVASAAQLMNDAIALGQKLARADMDKAAQFNAGVEVGQVMAKAALDLKSLANTAVALAKAHPEAALGGALGAAGGLAHGLQRDEQGHRHLLGGLAEGAMGGAAGAAAGHLGQQTHGLMQNGLGLGEALQTSAGALGNKLKAHATNLAANLEAGGREAVGKLRAPAGATTSLVGE